MADMQPESSATPIALFVFRREGHARRALQALKSCKGFDESRLWVFSDGPKSADQIDQVEAVRQLVRAEVPGAYIVEQAQNQGLARSIISGVAELLTKSDRVIVLEDDLLVSDDFLVWMDAALDRYADENRVMQVSGHMFGVDVGPDPVLLPFISTWGWGTWRRAWVHFDPALNGADALGADRALRRKFDVGGSYPYSRMLREQLAGRIDSWGVVWNWSVFANKGLVVYPPKSRIRNVGMDGAGTHGSRGASQKLFDGRAAAEHLMPVSFPSPEPSTKAFAKVASALRFEQYAKLVRRFLQ
jgi:hypothetical protein